MNLRIGVLGSTNGTSLQPIIDAIETKQLQANIAVVISNKHDSGILNKAIKHLIPYKYVNPIQENGKKKIEKILIMRSLTFYKKIMLNLSL